ncbi:hypothetical protein DFH09DRAFT_1096602 [Mycena vulgaris]|nr:hypothetical protein DFH09DRAFT_1096602 [Mycena vulgaris]
MRDVSAEKTSLRWREPLPKVLARENIRRLPIYFQAFWSRLGPCKRWCLFTLSTEKEEMRWKIAVLDTASKRTEPAEDIGRYWSDVRSSASRSPAQSSSYTSEYYATLQHPPSSMEFPLNIYLHSPEWDTLSFDAPQANPGFPYVDSGTTPACSNPLDLSEYSMITNSGPASDTITLPSFPNFVQLSLDSGLHRAAESLAGLRAEARSTERREPRLANPNSRAMIEPRPGAIV